MMIDNITKLLKKNKKISGWKINENKTESSELFFIKKSLDMKRSKTVNHTMLTVYVDFEENGSKYRGSSFTEIHPTMAEDEIEKAINRLTFAASLVKNKPYPLCSKVNTKIEQNSSNLQKKSLDEWAPEIVKAFYEPDIYEKGGINSAELFLNKITTHIINSEGVNVSYSHFAGNIEFITDWKENGEEIELYRDFKFTDFKPEIIKDEVKAMLMKCRDRASAKPTPALKDIPVLFTGTPVKEILSYYYVHASASAVYNKISTLKLGENAQGKEIKGDAISLFLDPALCNSVSSVPYDSDGFPLSKVQLYKEGVLKNYWGNVRFSHYLNIPATGNIENISISGGSKSIKELKSSPYLELVAFSDFQMDSLTGNFGGEIRLGYYNDGEKTVPVTGGSVSGNIKNVQSSMYLSKELQHDNNFEGPKTILLNNVSIAGCSK